MRIVHIGPAALPVGYPFGGAVERRIVELAAAQQRRGDDVMVVSLASEGDALRSDGPARDIPILDIVCRTQRPLRDMELLLRSRSQIRDFAPDVVHVHNSSTAAMCLAGIPAAKVLSFDYFRYRGSHRPLVKAAYRRALKSFDLLMPVSDFCRREAAEYWSLPLADFRVLPNGVNVEQFSPDDSRRVAARQRYDLDDALVIGYVGRVCEQKGSDTLVEAFRRVKQARPDTALLVAGPTGFFGRTGSTPLTDHIVEIGGRWLGPVPEDEVADVFRSLDICAMPTRHDEMFGMAAAEAMSSGTPVVCSDLGGLPEVVPPSAGVLVQPGDAEALAEELIALCDDRAALARLAAAGPGEASKFTWPAVAERAAQLYREVLTK
ncbi:glycosyltransferase family 4 protein [Mycolicibacterium litorale]|uniref:glycosyltransferase family 4 protein n=1 Tax=Mycolicibacterium litorale TaxID=758802 RepID=UPI003CE9A4B2